LSPCTQLHDKYEIPAKISVAAATIIEKGDADLVGVGRALAADPQWVAKAKALLKP